MTEIRTLSDKQRKAYLSRLHPYTEKYELAVAFAESEELKTMVRLGYIAIADKIAKEVKCQK